MSSLTQEQLAALQGIADWCECSTPADDPHRLACPAYVLGELAGIPEETWSDTLVALLELELIQDVTPEGMTELHREGGRIVNFYLWPPTASHRVAGGRWITLSRNVAPLTCPEQTPSSRNVLLGVKRGDDWEIAGVIVGNLIPHTCRLYRLRTAGWAALQAIAPPRETQDARIVADWLASGCRTYAKFEWLRGLPGGTVGPARNRHRKRLSREN